MHGYPRGKCPDRVVAREVCARNTLLVSQSCGIAPRERAHARGACRMPRSRRRPADRFCRWSRGPGRAILHPGGSHTTCSGWATRFAAHPGENRADISLEVPARPRTGLGRGRGRGATRPERAHRRERPPRPRLSAGGTAWRPRGCSPRPRRRLRAACGARPAGTPYGENALRVSPAEAWARRGGAAEV